MGSRRKFILNVGIATAAYNLLPLKTKGSNSECHLFLSESNNFLESKSPYTMGILKIDPLNEWRIIMDSIRNKYNYKCVFRYRSTDKFKFLYGKEVIELFLQEKSISFTARSIFGNLDSSSSTYLKEKTLMYYINWEKIINDSLSGNENAILYMSKFDENLKSYLLKNIPAIKDIKYNNDDDLNQISQFFSGSISADQSKIKNETKIGLLKCLKEGLGIIGPDKLYNYQNRKFKVSKIKI